MFHTKEGGILCMSFLYACVKVVELFDVIVPYKSTVICMPVSRITSLYLYRAH